MSKPRVRVWYHGESCWWVGIEARLVMDRALHRTILVAIYKTRDSANEYAKGLRKALRG